MKISRMIIMTTLILVATTIWLAGMRPRRARAQSTSLSGSYGFSIIAYSGVVAGTIQGVITLDGAGNATAGGGITMSPDPDPNATAPQVQPTKPGTGTYTVNPDGTGTITLQNPNGKVTSIAFVVTDGGSQLMVAVTGGLGNAIGTGTARRQ